jgi:hypothetical protein
VKNLECYDGWTDVSIFVYLGDELTLEECDGCAPLKEDENVVAYYFEVRWSIVVVIDTNAVSCGFPLILLVLIHSIGPL